ncbi:MAG: 1-(5-phosphoribosyl)-5-[(5-phosphoribosylamino)methylideneamino]imidazole-4-carboxamide isomerase [Methanocellales archaeon]
MFEVIPAIDLKAGKCVRLMQGDPDRETISIADPIAVARKWISEGAATLHLIDLDGAFKGVPENLEIVKQIISTFKVTTQLGGGIRSLEVASKLLDLGVNRVILGTAAINNTSLVEALAMGYGSERVMVALDSRDGEVFIEGWRKSSGYKAADLAKEFESKGAGSILFTNINVEGLIRGVDPEPVFQVVKAVSIPVIASGGVATIADLLRIKQTGAKGAVVGTALYKNKFTLKEAVEAVK